MVSDTKYNVQCMISRAGFIKVSCRISPFIDEEIERKEMDKRMMTKPNGEWRTSANVAGQHGQEGAKKNNAVEKDSVSNPVSANVTLPSPK